VIFFLRFFFGCAHRREQRKLQEWNPWGPAAAHVRFRGFWQLRSEAPESTRRASGRARPLARPPAWTAASSHISLSPWLSPPAAAGGCCREPSCDRPIDRWTGRLRWCGRDDEAGARSISRSRTQRTACSQSVSLPWMTREHRRARVRACMGGTWSGAAAGRGGVLWGGTRKLVLDTWSETSGVYA
jgi:hypothetical protein